MQFVCPYCGPIDWNNKYSYSYSGVNLLVEGTGENHGLAASH